LVSLGVVEAKSDTMLFVCCRSTNTMHILLYVDDIVLTYSRPKLQQSTTTTLQWDFTIKDLGPLHHFLNVSMET
jgi:hypothetical protein